METVKIKNKKTGVVKVVKKALASDYIGTGNFVIYTEEARPVQRTSKFTIDRDEK